MSDMLLKIFVLLREATQQSLLCLHIIHFLYLLYKLNAQMHADINECTEGTSTCDINADCADTDGSYSCTCKSGYQGDGTTCTSEL